MLAVVLPLVLAASRIVVAGNEPAAAQAAVVAAGHTALPADAVYAFTHLFPRIIPLDAAPPAGWPKDLPWDDVLSTCRNQTDPPPWTIKSSLLCGRHAAAFLWQRYTDNVTADRVIEYSVNKEHGRFRATAITYTPASTETRTLTTSSVSSAAAVTSAIKDVLEGQGEVGARVILPPLDPVEKIEDNAPARQLIVDGVCSLPSTLDFAEKSGAGTALAAAWLELDAKTRTNVASTDCILRGRTTPGTADFPMGGMSSFTWDLHCPGLKPVSQRVLALSLEVSARIGMKKVAERAAQDWCPKP